VKRVVAVLLVLGLLVGGGVLAALTALGGGDGGTPTPRGPAPTTTPEPGATRPPTPALEPFYSQTLDWSPCQDEFECATLTVPLDYHHPGGDRIELALLKVPAGDPGARIGSLVVNPGGPGAPGTSYAASASRAFREPLRDHFDIVGFDPRGVGDSHPVDCLSDEQLDDYLAGDPDPDTPDEVDALMAQAREFGAGCEQRSGALAAHMSTVEAARDMDVLRAALGESTLTYFGASYGTELGATYADLFPKKSGRLVLDGAVDPAQGPVASARSQARGFETALRAYVANCVETTDSCFLGSSVDEGLARIQQFLDDVDADPLPTGGDRELTEGLAVYGIVLPLYDRDYWYVLSQALKSAFGGDGTTLLLLADSYAMRGRDGYTTNLIEANHDVNCLDSPGARTPAEVQALLPSFERAAPTFGASSAWSLTGCSGFTARAADKPRQLRAVGAPPIVVIGTTRDPATPYQQAVALARELEPGVLVSRDGDGHTGYNSGNDCVDEAVEGYLVDGTVPEDGLSC
jgi:pimeloyl-ACP methyl ester carboxylesterase